MMVISVPDRSSSLSIRARHTFDSSDDWYLLFFCSFSDSVHLFMLCWHVPAGSELVSCNLRRVDEAASRDGVRQERVSNCLENLIKAKAFVYFLQTGGWGE